MERTSTEHEHRPAQALAEVLAKLQQELNDGQARLQAQRARRHELLGELKSARATASDLSWELEDLEQRLRDLKAQREGPGDPLLDRELTSITARRTALEEQVLAQLLLVDDLAARVASEEQALASEERDWAAHSAHLLAERDRIRKLLPAENTAE